MPDREAVESETKTRIFRAALLAFSKKGFASTTMREIAGAVGIQAASLYNHYESKDALLVEVYRFIRSLAPGRESPENITDLEAFFEAVILSPLGDYEDPYREAASAVLAEEQYHDPRAAELVVSVTDAFLAALASRIRGLQKGFQYHGDPSAEVLALWLGSTTRMLYMEYGIRRRNGLPTEPVLDRLKALKAHCISLFSPKDGETPGFSAENS